MEKCTCSNVFQLNLVEWNKAQTDFFEAFKNYDEAGSESRIKVLQYLVIANMLSLSSINPFDSQETKPYKQDAAIISLTKLVDAFQARDLVSFNSVLKKMNNDEFIERYIPRVLKLIQKRVLVDIVKPYTRVKLEFVALKLSVQVDYVEELVVELVLDGDIKGRMDMVERILILDRGEKDEFFVGLGQWGDNLEQMMRKIAVN